ncbi:MAG: hypothetical protein NTU54_04420, partial [Candidatus Omnitrophica bacterium]|nr:hypothetical protein [Candidatus Omnitrophota bacterium]
ISSATNSAYTFTPQAGDNAAQFRCIVTNSAGSATSNAVGLTVNAVLTVNATNGMVASNPLGTQISDGYGYSVNTVVTLTATPDAGYIFSSWDNAAPTTTPNIAIVIMDSNKTVTAIFDLEDTFYSTPTEQNVLCVYNKNSGSSDETGISRDICSYYLQKRYTIEKGYTEDDRDISNSKHALGLDIPDEAFITRYDQIREIMVEKNFAQYVSQPILNYVTNHPELNITHLAVAKDIPILVCDSLGVEGVSGNQFLFFNANKNTTVADIKSAIGKLDRGGIQPGQHFDPSKCQANSAGLKYRFAVSYITGYTLEDIEHMLDKAQGGPPDLSKDEYEWLLDIDSKGSYLSECRDTRDKLRLLGIDQNNISIEQTNTNPLKVSKKLVAYGGMGSHHEENTPEAYGAYWLGDDSTTVAVEKPAIYADVADRAIIDAYESYFGVTATLGAWESPLGQGKISQAFQPNTFGGNEYSRSFSGGVGTVAEPLVPGLVKFYNIFPEYASGKTFAESFLSSSFDSSGLQSLFGMAIGDPLMRLQDKRPVFVPPTNEAPEIRVIIPNQTLNPSTYPTTWILNKPGLENNIFDDTLPVGSSITLTWSMVSGPPGPDRATFGGQASSVTTYPNTNQIGSPYTVSTEVTLPRAGIYVLRLTASDGELSSTRDVTITANAPASPPIVYAGPDQTITAATLPVDVSVDVSMQGNVSRSDLTAAWRFYSGPRPDNKSPKFSSRTSPTATVTFYYRGTYVLRFQAYDKVDPKGNVVFFSDVTITIN